MTVEIRKSASRVLDMLLDQKTSTEFKNELCGLLQRVQLLDEQQAESHSQSELYYIRNEGYVGNACIWWGKDSKGYTTNLDKAGKYTRSQAEKICSNRREDIAYKCSNIDNHLFAKIRTIDAQYLEVSDIAIGRAYHLTEA